MKTKLNNKDIELKNPVLLDLREYKIGWLNQFDTLQEFLDWIKHIFGWDKLNYDFSHRYGEDSSTKRCDLYYSQLRVGDELLWLHAINMEKDELTPIRIIHKYGHIIFYESLLDGKKSYFDVGGDEYTLDKNDDFTLSSYWNVYPFMVVYDDSYIKIKTGTFPSIVKLIKASEFNEEEWKDIASFKKILK